MNCSCFSVNDIAMDRWVITENLKKTKSVQHSRHPIENKAEFPTLHNELSWGWARFTCEKANFQMNILSYLLGEVLRLNFLLATRFFPCFFGTLNWKTKKYIYQPRQFETNTSFKILILPQAIEAISVLQIERKAIS